VLLGGLLNYTIELSHTTKVRADFGGHFNKYFFPKRHALQRIDTKIGEFTPVNTPVLAILPAFRSRQKTTPLQAISAKNSMS
jgi:hypothetical protein